MGDDISSALNGIWRLFHQEGISDDLTIVEYLAALLGAREFGLWDELYDAAREWRQEGPWSDFDRNVHEVLSKDGGKARDERAPIPRLPVRVRFGVCVRIMDDLEFLLNNKVSPGDLLDRHIMMHMDRMLAGGQYPTPRHLADLMSTLIDPERNDSLLDPVCGSGGLLVAAQRYGRGNASQETATDVECASPQEGPQPKLHVTGYDISLTMARIAWANLRLNGIPHPDIAAINSLPIQYEIGTYDGVIMNPPFGTGVDAAMAGAAFQDNMAMGRGGRSETLLSYKGWQALKPGGRMAVLLPASTLFGTSRAEQALRRRIMAETSELEVIQLPADATQPFSAIRSYLMVAEKGPRPAKTPFEVWLYRLAHDGLSAGRNRRPEEGSQIPALEAAALAIRERRHDGRAGGGSRYAGALGQERAVGMW